MHGLNEIKSINDWRRTLKSDPDFMEAPTAKLSKQIKAVRRPRSGPRKVTLQGRTVEV